MVNVYCVKWGTKYDRSFVENLKTSIEKHFTIEHKFICFTDKPEKDYDIPITHPELRGVWHKLALFQFTGEKPQKLLLKHNDLNREMNLVRNFWELDESSSLLHSMSLYNPFGIVDSLMSPLSAGGRVVLLPQFDTTKVSFLFNQAN